MENARNYQKLRRTILIGVRETETYSYFLRTGKDLTIFERILDLNLMKYGDMLDSRQTFARNLVTKLESEVLKEYVITNNL